MATDYGKLSRAISTLPTAAFPLDAREYFESMSALVQSAESAVEAGTSQTVAYYIGQTLTLVENGKSSQYIITGTVESGLKLEKFVALEKDKASIEYDSDLNALKFIFN